MYCDKSGEVSVIFACYRGLDIKIADSCVCAFRSVHIRKRRNIVIGGSCAESKRFVVSVEYTFKNTVVGGIFGITFACRYCYRIIIRAYIIFENDRLSAECFAAVNEVAEDIPALFIVDSVGVAALGEVGGNRCFRELCRIGHIARYGRNRGRPFLESVAVLVIACFCRRCTVISRSCSIRYIGICFKHSAVSIFPSDSIAVCCLGVLCRISGIACHGRNRRRPAAECVGILCVSCLCGRTAVGRCAVVCNGIGFQHCAVIVFPSDGAGGVFRVRIALTVECHACRCSIARCSYIGIDRCGKA